MAKPEARISVLQAALVLGVLAVVGRAAHLQLVKGEHYAEVAAERRLSTLALPARRGTIYDRTGAPLAISQDYYRITFAANEVQDTAALIRLVASRLSLSQARLWASFRSTRYPYLHGPFSASQVEDLRDVKGVHLKTIYLRSYPSGGLARQVVGALHPDSGFGESGLERTFDSLLSGRAGEAVYLKDGAGRLYESPARLKREPVAGHDLVLTIESGLQSIAETGLTDAIRDLDAEGGDVVFLDLRTGEVLAVASQRARGSSILPSASAFTSPFEPGSTAKLFTAAALLRLGRVDSLRSVSGEGGRWAMQVSSRRTRVITDTHREDGQLTLARAIQVSSNIAMSKFSLLLRPEEQYEALRDFGFGSPTGIEFPSEASGRLEHPDRWESGYSGPSLAMGYEFGVTALQLAAAYAAIANDGVLLAPTLLREVRGPSGREIYRHEPEVVRRVVPSEVAARLREFLREAAGDSGTGGRVQLRTVRVLGKTGTARLFENGAYHANKHTASFAGIFPAEEPQLVVIVKLINPRGAYGGLTAAPLTRRMLEEALASRGSAVDRRRMPMSAEGTRPVTAKGQPLEDAAPLQVATVPLGPPDAGPPQASEIPDVTGLAVRQAILMLHRRGFRVDLRGEGMVVRTQPVAGDSAAAGGRVVVWAGSSRAP